MKQQRGKRDLGSEQYSTAAFRRGMADAFASARYRDKIVHVYNHGKPWVSIVSPESASTIEAYNAIGAIEVSEIQDAIASVDGPLELDELARRILQARDAA